MWDTIKLYCGIRPPTPAEILAKEIAELNIIRLQAIKVREDAESNEALINKRLIRMNKELSSLTQQETK